MSRISVPAAGMDVRLRTAAEAARGFMPPEEGLALYEAAAGLPQQVEGALLEIGAYCGKSAIYLGAAARMGGRVLFSLDHHRGSEENQPGWEWHEPDLVDAHAGQIDTLPFFRRTILDAGLEREVVAIVGESSMVARWWPGMLAFVFIDGGHGREPAHADYRCWSPKVVIGGRLAIHDVFPDPRDGGSPPYEIYCAAVESGEFRELEACGSLRVLQRVR